MRPTLRLSLLLATSSLVIAPAALADSRVATATAAASSAIADPTPVPELIEEVKIPHEKFVLDNGLTVLVHEDRKAPVVGVAMWYNVGSKDEPKGKTGFAHLFEHLMFNGTENLPGDYFKYLQQMGATDTNGTTNFDRTNYFQTVPRGGLERVLFMESDRMGHLLGAVTQGVLDNQRGVVQNEKRQGDNQPGGLVFYEILESLFPEGHPYHHSVIGSMADLDSASLEDVRQWFYDKYGPNNATLVLAGDINAAEARPLVEKYFGHIKRGPDNIPAAADIPTLNQAKRTIMKDRVASTRVGKYWPMPGLLDRQLVALDVGGSIFGGLASSRLDQILVRDEKLATQVSAGLFPAQRVGIFFVQAEVKPGVDPALVERRIDEILADYLANGPSADEVRRAATSEVAGRIRGLEQVGGFGGKAVTLAQGEVLAADSDFYAKTLANYATVTPDEIKSAMNQWLTKPAFILWLMPGEREAYEEAASVTGAAKDKPAPDTPAAPRGEPREIPELGKMTALDFPDIVNARLSNGLEVEYVQRTTVPLTQLAISFDAGDAADPVGKRGMMDFMMGLLDEGTSTMTSQQIAEAEEELGASISQSSSTDRSTVTLSALSPNLEPSLALMGAMIKDPAFADAEVDRVRNQVLTSIANLKKDPSGIAQRLLPGLLFGASHPYAGVPGGDEAAIKAATRAELMAYKDKWLRPDNAKIYVVSDKPLEELMPALEAEFGNWAAPSVPKGVKTFTAVPARLTAPKIILVDRPQSPQSMIYAAQVTPVQAKGDLEALMAANDVLGGNFLSRINMDLREAKGWSYGARGSVQQFENAVPYIVRAPVQADRTGDSIVAINEQLTGFFGDNGVNDEELGRTIANRMLRLPGLFETSGDVLSSMMTLDYFDRPDDYYETLADKYRGLTADDLNMAIRGAVDPSGFVWVVVGDAEKVRPQLEKLNIPIEVMEPR